MNAYTSARIASTILYFVIGFQLLVVAGAPLGQYTQGGQTLGTLSAGGRFFAFVSAAVLLIMALSLQALVQKGPLTKLRTQTIRRIVWITAIYSLLGAAMNAISRSAVERPWAIVTGLVAFLSYRALKLTK